MSELQAVPDEGYSPALQRLLERKTPITTSTELVIDAAAVEAANEARERADRLHIRASRRPNDEALTAEADEAEALAQELADTVQADGSIQRFRFQALGGRSWDALVKAHPVPAEHKKLQVSWNPETFPSACVAACIVDPPLSAEDVEAMWQSDRFSNPQLARLFGTALEANTTLPDLKR